MHWSHWEFPLNKILDLRYTGVTPAPPPGNTHTSPSEDYWAQVGSFTIFYNFFTHCHGQSQ